MRIEYADDKVVSCYKNYVQNPQDRVATKAFTKIFGAAMLAPAKKLHDRLLLYPTVGDYNVMFASTKNRIELKQGGAANEPLVLKVRVGLELRKFFGHLLDSGDMALVRQWAGDFKAITAIYVIDVNNHEYKL